jgi:hypothetical protein
LQLLQFGLVGGDAVSEALADFRHDDPAHVVILPEGQCPGAAVHNAPAGRRLASALATIGPQDEPL